MPNVGNVDALCEAKNIMSPMLRSNLIMGTSDYAQDTWLYCEVLMIHWNRGTLLELGCNVATVMMVMMVMMTR